MLRDELHEQGVIYSEKSPRWTLPHIKSILRNEKYCGDVLMQKTFQQDVINRKVIKNTGQLPMYLIENHHEGIVSREKYNAVQAEMARRKAAKSPSKRASTGLAAYTSRYALSDRLVCGECGTLYRRCTWTRPDGKRVVWRCVSRLDYGKKYCSDSPIIMEDKLQEAIVRAVNKFNEQDNATYKALMRATISEALGLNGDPEEVDMLERSGSCSIWQFPIKRIPSSKRCTKGGIFCLRGLEDGMLGEGRGGAKRKLCHKPMKIHFSS